MKTLMDLAKRFEKLPGQIKEGASEAAKAAARAFDVNVTEHTPVDTTEAVSNWQAEINAAPSFPLPPIYPGKQGSTAEQSRAAAIAHVERTLTMKDPGEPIYLANLAAHIILLNNNGTSTQEPAGFVERAVFYARKEAKRTKLIKVK